MVIEAQVSLFCGCGRTGEYAFLQFWGNGNNFRTTFVDLNVPKSMELCKALLGKDETRPDFVAGRSQARVELEFNSIFCDEYNGKYSVKVSKVQIKDFELLETPVKSTLLGEVPSSIDTTEGGDAPGF